MPDCKLSVIVPVYNMEKYLRSCLDSIIAQTYSNTEIILVNDGSTDSSGNICDEYALKDSRIKVLHQKNQYVGIARNNGMDIASGEYLIFLDSDDYFEPNMFETMLNTAEENNSDIVICKEQAYYEKEQDLLPMNWAQKLDKIPPKTFSGDDIPNDILTCCVLYPWDKMYKTSFLKENKILFPIDRTVSASEDLVFVGHTMALAKRINFINNVFITHRYHSKSLAANRNKNAASVALKMLEERLKNANLYEKYLKSFMNLALDHLLWSINVSNQKNKKEEILIAKETFKYFNFDKYDESYFDDREKYYKYLKISHPWKSKAVSIRNYIKHLKTITETLNI